jgi:hypothetical protein
VSVAQPLVQEKRLRIEHQHVVLRFSDIAERDAGFEHRAMRAGPTRSRSVGIRSYGRRRCVSAAPDSGSASTAPRSGHHTHRAVAGISSLPSLSMSPSATERMSKSSPPPSSPRASRTRSRCREAGGAVVAEGHPAARRERWVPRVREPEGSGADVFLRISGEATCYFSSRVAFSCGRPPRRGVPLQRWKRERSLPPPVPPSPSLKAGSCSSHERLVAYCLHCSH